MFQVLHSSAGAGKTHALVRHYLGLCLSSENTSAYRQILALTFTNKAAGELKERVILYLEDLAKGRMEDGRIRDLMDHLMAAANVSEAVIIARAEACLKHMLHHWSEVAISTIDAFTRRVVQPFARDLQLDHDLRMTTEENYYRDLAVDRLIAEVGEDERITTLLSGACLQLLHEERKWDPEKPLKELSAELSKESSMFPLQKLRSLAPEDVAPLADRLRSQEIAFRRRVNALGSEALNMISDAGVAVEELAYGKAGIYSYFKKLCAFADEWDPPGANALKTLENDKWCSAKAGPSAIAALNGICDGLTRIFNEAEGLRQDGHRTYVIRRAVARELLPALALHELDVRLTEVKQADAVAFFSDLTRKVSEVVKDEPVPFIYERLGERYRHFLIDEFQDTSMQQWNALLPLIDNALGTQGSALLVGDAKQAIYRWRNGEVRLFVELPRLFGKGDDRVSAEREGTLVRNFQEGERLAYNHRSAGTIIDFNNNLFASLKDQLAPHLQAVYKNHDQLVRKEQPGLIHLEPLPKDLVGDARKEEQLRFTLQAVKDSIADGFAPGDIAILVRGKNLGRMVAAELVKKKYAVVSPDGLQLSGDPLIELLVDHLRFLHTADPTAAARIAQYKSILATVETSTTAIPFDEGGPLPDPLGLLHTWSKEHRYPRLRTTLAALIAELARAHGLKPAEDAQVLALLDEAHKWSSDHGQDIGGFLEHWTRAGNQRSVEPPENGQAIQVMTVHRSKGLQFPVVIVPNACMSTKGDLRERIWINPGEAVPELAAALVKSGKALRDAALPELEEEASLSVLDSLDLLYVAFTRPEQRLYAKVQVQGADGITRELLRFMEENGAEGKLIDGVRRPPWKPRDLAHNEALKDVAGGHEDLPLSIRFEAPHEWDPGDPDPYRSHGNVVHDLLAEVTSANDLDRAITAAVQSCDLDEAAAIQLRKALGPVICSEAFAPWFGEGLEVRSESTIITGTGHSLRPDRVVFDKDKIRVLDIKTGKAYQDHQDQVREYMRQLKELTGREVEGALFYVRDGSILHVPLHEPEIHRESL